MKKVTITFEDKKYTLTFNRKTAAMYGDMGHEISDLSSTTKAFAAIPAFVMCALKANHPTITQKKVDAIWEAVPKKSKGDVLSALFDMYSATYIDLMGSDNAADEDDEGNAAAVEFEE